MRKWIASLPTSRLPYQPFPCCRWAGLDWASIIQPRYSWMPTQILLQSTFLTHDTASLLPSLCPRQVSLRLAVEKRCIYFSSYILMRKAYSSKRHVECKRSIRFFLPCHSHCPLPSSSVTPPTTQPASVELRATKTKNIDKNYQHFSADFPLSTALWS